MIFMVYKSRYIACHCLICTWEQSLVHRNKKMQQHTWRVWRPAVAGRNATLTGCASPGASAMCRSPPSRSKASCGAMDTRAAAGRSPVLRSSTVCIAEPPCTCNHVAQDAMAALHMMQLVSGLKHKSCMPQGAFCNTKKHSKIAGAASGQCIRRKASACSYFTWAVLWKCTPGPVHAGGSSTATEGSAPSPRTCSTTGPQVQVTWQAISGPTRLKHSASCMLHTSC